MSEYLTSTFSSDNYDKFRPTYPDSFIKHVVSWHFNRAGKGPGQVFVDIGCGTGQATFPVYEEFHNDFDRVLGVDPGTVMIEKCKEIQLRRYPNSSARKLGFHKAPAEDLRGILEDESVDLMTGAECVHWFKQDVAFKEIARVLKPNASLALWCYLDPVIVSGTTPAGEVKVVNFDAYMNIYRKFVFEDDRYLGPMWDDHGRAVFQNHCKSVELPDAYYKDIQKHWFYPTIENSGGDSDEKLVIRRKWKLSDYRNLLKSWSPYHRFVETNKNSGKYGDIVNFIPDTFVGEFKEKLGLEEDDELDIVWSSVQFYATRK